MPKYRFSIEFETKETLYPDVAEAALSAVKVGSQAVMFVASQLGCELLNCSSTKTCTQANITPLVKEPPVRPKSGWKAGDVIQHETNKTWIFRLEGFIGEKAQSESWSCTDFRDLKKSVIGDFTPPWYRVISR